MSGADMVIWVNFSLLTMLCLSAVAILLVRHLFAVAALTGAFSLLAAGLFVALDAVDVAFTEAAVGAGISTVLFLAAMAYVPADEKPRGNHNLVAALVCVIAGMLLLGAVIELPTFGDIAAPVHQHVAPRYIAESGSALHIPNIVTTVLASYRGFDTLGETIVVFTAGLGVLMLLAGITRTHKMKRHTDKASRPDSPKSAAPKSRAKGGSA